MLQLSVLASVGAGVALVLTPLGGPLGFAPLPPGFFLVLAALAAAYLLLVEVVKRRVYRVSGWAAAGPQVPVAADATIRLH